MHAAIVDRRLMTALILSAVLHLLVALAMQVSDLSALLPERIERSMEVEVIPEPPRSPPIPAPQPEPPKPPPTPESPMPIQRPQLQPAPLAEKSVAPRPSPRPEPVKAATTAPGLSADTGSFSRPAPAAGDLAQSAQDKVLAQVVRMWHFDSALLRGTNTVLTATLVVNRDGTLSGPMHKDAPWKPDLVIKGYSALPDGTTRRMLETFLLALRMAQPLQLPPDDGKPWPRRMLLKFKPGDL